jgi:energy-coupling factor transporter ATP-binding protein EcfA2
VVKAEHLSKSYGSKEVFRNISFQVERGQRLIVIGLNGVGKTTLLRTLLGLRAISGGPSTGRASRTSGTHPVTRWASPLAEEVYTPCTLPGVCAERRSPASCTSRLFLVQHGCVFTQSPSLWNPYTIQLFKVLWIYSTRGANRLDKKQRPCEYIRTMKSSLHSPHVCSLDTHPLTEDHHPVLSCSTC